MLIEVLRSGGIAGITRRGVVDTDSIADATDWHSLVDAARPLLDQLPSPGVEQSQVRDGFSWTLTIGGQACVTDDSALTGPLRDLAERTLREGQVH